MAVAGKARRPYTSPLREESARRTREAIVTAATRLFVEQGYERTSFDAVARAAGVSRPTVVTAFGSKPALAARVLEEALAGDDEPVPVRDRAWFRPVWAAPTATETLAAYAHVCVVIGARAAEVVEALHRAADSHPELASLWRRWLTDRRAGAAMVVEREVVATALRPGLTVRTAGDVLWTLNDPAQYLALVRGQGWSEQTFETWLADAMCTLLLGLPGESPSGPPAPAAGGPDGGGPVRGS